MPMTSPATAFSNSPSTAPSPAPFVAARPFASSGVIFAFALVNLLVQGLVDWQEFFLSQEIGFVIIGISLPLVAAFVYRRFNSLSPVLERLLGAPTESVHSWFRNEQAALSGNWMTYTGYAILAVAVDVTLIMTGLPWQGLAYLLILMFAGLFMLATATLAWMYVRFLVCLVRLERFEVKGTTFEWPEQAFGELNSTYQSVFVVGALLYLTLVFFVWLGPTGAWLVLYHPLGRVWILPIAATVAGYFLVCQYYLHRLMTRSKQRRIQDANAMITSMLDHWRATPSLRNAKLVTEVLSWRDRVNRDSEWPLDFKSILFIVSGLLLPMANLLIDSF